MKARNFIAFGISALALVAIEARAQEEQASPPEAAADDDQSFGDIVVTARRRAERLQDVPISVQAFNSEALTRAGIEKTENLQLSTPTLRIAPQSNGRATPVFELRGINSFDVLATQDPAVAVYVNDVYQARPVGLNQPLLDIDNVQVLLGPQGTLFGRNSTAGAILFASKRPTDEFEGELATRFGNYGRLDFSAIVNIPVSETLSVRLAGQRVKRDGYTIDQTNGRDYDDDDSWSGRASVLWTPTDRLENYFVFDYFEAHENGTSNILYATRPNFGANGVFPNAAALAAQQRQWGPRRIAIDQNLFARSKAYGVANTTAYELSDSVTLKNVFGYRNVRATSANDLDGTANAILQVNLLNSGRQFSDELQLQGKAFDDALTWIAGVYYFHEKTRYRPMSVQRTSASTASIPSVNNTFGTNESYSVFAQGSYETPLDGLSVTLGGRYSWDKRHAEFRNPYNGVPSNCAISGLPAGAPCQLIVRADFAKPSWTASIDYKFAPGKLVYVTHRRGYRSGGFNSRASSVRGAEPFQPEIVTDFEAGIKADWDLGGGARLRTNVAAYTNNYDQIQRNVASPVGNPPISTTTIVNAAKAKINGIEANVTLEPVHGFSINGFWGYVDAIHKEFRFVPTAGAVGQRCGDQTIAAASVGAIFTCTNVPFGVAKQTYGGAVTVTPIDGDNGTISLTANVFHSTKILGTQQLPLFDPEAVIPGYTVVNAVISWDRIMGSSVSADLYMNNVFNDAYPVSIQSQQGLFGLSSVTYNEPRMYGIRLKYAFGGS